MLTIVDYLVIAAYLVGVVAFGLLAGGRQKTTTDYFLGNRDLPWWAVAFSVVATETSTLTVIGVPAVAYAGSLTFLQLALGYIVGRLVVSVLFLPRYFEGELVTAYAYLGARYGDGMRATASLTFMVTRLLADGVRLFATAIPLRVIAVSAGLEVAYWQIILAIGIATVLYTFVGGIRAVIWMDVIQMFVYVGGAVLAIVVLLGRVPEDWLLQAGEMGKTQLFVFDTGNGLNGLLTQPYAFVTAVLGGAIFSMASHGTDQLIVQRLLTCRDLKESQKALVVSGIVVFVQFAIFLVVGLLLWARYAGATAADLGLQRLDEVFPKFIIEGLPPGVSGFILAGIIAAAMSTLSSSLNSLASSTMLDLYERFRGVKLDEVRGLRLSRWSTLVWGAIFVVFANLFESQENPVVELGLAIASFTYGGLLGVFLLGLVNRRTRQADAVISFLVTIAAMVFIIFGVWYSPTAGWIFALDPSEAMREELALVPIAWPWYTLIGSALTLTIGSLMALRHR